MPHVAAKAWCLAPDLIGFGASGKPDIAYSFLEHAAYLEAFLQQMDVEEFTLVGQDWGGALPSTWRRATPPRCAAWR